MRRIGALIFTLLMILTSNIGCEDTSQEVQPTGVELRFSNCLTFGVWVFVDDDYKGTASSEEPKFYSVLSGSHTLYARSNGKIEGVDYCWTIDFSVSDGNTTLVQLSCIGAECPEE